MRESNYVARYKTNPLEFVSRIIIARKQIGIAMRVSDMCVCVCVRDDEMNVFCAFDWTKDDPQQEMWTMEDKRARGREREKDEANVITNRKKNNFFECQTPDDRDWRNR